MVLTVQKPPPKIAQAGDILPVVLRLSPLIELTDEQFAEFCGLNRDLRIERTAAGELEIMAPAFSETSNRNIKIAAQLEIWARHDKSGIAFDSSAGFTLPNGAVRGPDASWISMSRLEALTPEQRSGFYNVCPDFVLELRSDTDRLTALQSKMQEYMDNGARLGWLIDPSQRRVYIYRPGQQTQILDNPQSVSADPILPGFTLHLAEVWDPWQNLFPDKPE